MKRPHPVDLLKESAKEIKKTRSLVIVAMLLGMQVILGTLASIPVGPTIRISFGYLALSSAGALFGPVASAINGALADIIGFLIHPTGAYFPGFTITGIVSGLIYGFGLFRREPTILRVLIVKLLIDVICNLLLNTIWLNMLYGKAFWVLLPSRVIKNLAQYPVDVLLLYPLLKLVRRIEAKR